MRGLLIVHVVRRRNGIVIGLVVLLCAMVVPPPLGPTRAEAAGNCKLTLDSGQADPPTGTTRTSITFTILVSYKQSCSPPSDIIVEIVGLASSPTTALSAGATSTSFGTVSASYSARRTIGTTGRWAYRFAARESTAHEWTTASGTSPDRVTISAPVTPAPKPTTKPTPKPTFRPTPRSTPMPTTRPASRPTGRPTTEPAPERSVAPSAEPILAGPETAAPTDPSAGTSTYPPDPTRYPITAAVPVAPVRTPSARAQPLAGPPLGDRPGAFDIGAIGLVWLGCGLVGSAVFVHLLGRRTRPDAVPWAVALATARVMPPAAALDAPPLGPPVELDPPAIPPDPEAQIPRWRRPSLQAARQSRGLAPMAVREPLRFRDGSRLRELRVVEYRMVRVADRPDDLEAEELGRLDRGDEVDVLERARGYALVSTPNGLRGWVEAATLGHPSDPGPAAAGPTARP
ncbi:MAG TPA: SH3 domain-containing protein [Clostridia bacterium]|nr:SH3 domain-containing protein [Clostridia bacterium]